MTDLSVAICTYNGGTRLIPLIDSLSSLACPIPFRILVVDNNSDDDTPKTLETLKQQHTIPITIIKETRQGIPYARNRAIEESLSGRYLAFIDDDELPGPNWLNAAIDALVNEHALCVGGEIRVCAKNMPGWMNDELAAFLGQLKHADKAFWINDKSTPVWSGNVAYNLDLFRNGLRFDIRYNRQGKGIGGGSDAIMFYSLLENNIRIRYRPDMLIEHHVPSWKLTQRYFLKLHYLNGVRVGRFEGAEYSRTLFGIPPFLLHQALQQNLKTIGYWLGRKPGYLRQAMNACFALGIIKGRRMRCKEST